MIIIREKYNIIPKKPFPIVEEMGNKDIEDQIINRLGDQTSISNLSVFIREIVKKFEEELKDNQYYFIEKKFLQLDIIKKNEKKLHELQEKDISNISVNRYNIHRYELSTKIPKDNFIATVYDKLNTNPLIQYIQWINDTYKII